MNLTKGKISKLYSKKKQSLKRNKNKRGHSGKSKTFRKNRRINLARKSLKRFHFKANKGGGLNDENGTVNDNELPKEQLDNKKIDENIENGTSNDDTKAEPSQVIGSAFTSPPETPAFAESSSSGDQAPFETTTPPPIVEETPPPVEETPSAPIVDESSPSVDVTPPAVDVTPPAVDVTPPAVDVTPPAVEETPPTVEETPPTVEETPPAPSVDPVVEETPAPPVNESTNNEDPKLASAINEVVELITEKVTKRVSEEVNANSSDAAQNGFKEIDDTARIMGSSGGGKKSKTKKSRKNKTRRKNKTKRTA